MSFVFDTLVAQGSTNSLAGLVTLGSLNVLVGMTYSVQLGWFNATRANAGTFGEEQALTANAGGAPVFRGFSNAGTVGQILIPRFTPTNAVLSLTYVGPAAGEAIRWSIQADPLRGAFQS